MAADERGPGCGMALMGEAEADARLDAALAEKPGDRDALWLFAYGALMWRPEFPVAERRAATCGAGTAGSACGSPAFAARRSGPA